ncbi:MAG TPA: CPBP family glutamic-type intramembrane protease [Allosphingosinicella sp.]|nr:CPBP family glutamic-type intramembrane protease [Allosphingosinicella sp.]
MNDDLTERHGLVPERQLHLRFLPPFVSDTTQPKALYILKGWLLTILPSIALAVLISIISTAIAGGAQGPSFPQRGPLLAFLLVLFAPVVETLIMVPPLLLLNRLFGPTAAAILSAIGWAVAHSLQVPIWGFIIWWPFFVFSVILLVWREKSLLTGMLIVIAIHALQNAIPALLLLAREA